MVVVTGDVLGERADTSAWQHFMAGPVSGAGVIQNAMKTPMLPRNLTAAAGQYG
jgi:hypothetical protein